MTINYKIKAMLDDFMDSIGRTPTHLYLGEQEQRALLYYFNDILAFDLTLASIQSGKAVYIGLNITPVSLPTYLGVGEVIVLTDPTVQEGR
jgi:hypothetical protein